MIERIRDNQKYLKNYHISYKSLWLPDVVPEFFTYLKTWQPIICFLYTFFFSLLHRRNGLKPIGTYPTSCQYHWMILILPIYSINTFPCCRDHWRRHRVGFGYLAAQKGLDVSDSMRAMKGLCKSTQPDAYIEYARNRSPPSQSQIPAPASQSHHVQETAGY